MAHKRIFIAFDISSEALQSASKHIDELRKHAGNVRVSWERPEKLHVTLKFLGNVDEGRLAEIQSAVAQVSSRHRAIFATLAGTGVFPSQRRPRVLWLGIEEKAGQIGVLADELELSLKHLGFERESRRFKPHLTIARVREPEGAGDLARLHLERSIHPIAFSISELVIYESKLGSAGSTYSVLSRHPLTS